MLVMGLWLVTKLECIQFMLCGFKLIESQLKTLAYKGDVSSISQWHKPSWT